MPNPISVIMWVCQWLVTEHRDASLLKQDFHNPAPPPTHLSMQCNQAYIRWMHRDRAGAIWTSGTSHRSVHKCRERRKNKFCSYCVSCSDRDVTNTRGCPERGFIAGFQTLNHSDTENFCHQKRVFQPDTALSFCLRNKYIHPATEIMGVRIRSLVD